jgi:uncharacterized Ntn-hydrolase superfamily protein
MLSNPLGAHPEQIASQLYGVGRMVGISPYIKFGVGAGATQNI